MAFSDRNTIVSAGAMLLSSCAGPDTEALAIESPGDQSDIAQTTLMVAETTNLQESSNFSTLTVEQQELAIAVFERLPVAAKPYLVTLLNRQVKETQRSALTDTDFLGGDILSTLYALAVQPMHHSLMEERRLHITTLLHELACPGELDQRGRGVCGTCIVFHLYNEYPAEAARIATALLSVKGEAPSLTPGESFTRPIYWNQPYAKDFQTRTEMLITTAFMDVANGAEEYCAHCDKSFDKKTGKITRGLSGEEQKHLWNVLFGTDQAVCMRVIGHTDEDRATQGQSKEQVYQAFLQHARSSVCSLSLIWKTDKKITDWSKVVHIHDDTDTEETESHLIIKEALPTKKADTAHAVIMTRIDAHHVYFKNLQRGETSWPKGHEFEEPSRVLVDPDVYEQRMELSVLKERLIGFIGLDTTKLDLRSR